jgi:hypothetical protein
MAQVEEDFGTLNETTALLTAARSVLAREGGWGQHSYRANGKCCLLGALREEAAGVFLFGRGYIAYLCLTAALYERTGRRMRLAEWNDEGGRTQGEVVALYDRAIEIAEEM